VRKVYNILTLVGTYVEAVPIPRDSREGWQFAVTALSSLLPLCGARTVGSPLPLRLHGAAVRVRSDNAVSKAHRLDLA
jgi:hypothetical protein